MTIRHISYNEIECDRCHRTLNVWDPETKGWRVREEGDPKTGYAERHYCPACASPTKQ